MSSTLQKIHQEKVSGAVFEGTDGEAAAVQSTVGFVDDNNKCVTREETHPITKTLQKNAQKWEILLYSSGGSLGFNKCFTYIIKWEYDEEDSR